MDARKSSRIEGRILRHVAAQLGGLLLAVALLSGLTHANARYFYCEAMGLVAVDPCAVAVSGEEQGPTRVAELRPSRFDCCEVITLPSLPASTTITTVTVPPASCTATIPVAAVADDRHAKSTRAATDGEQRRTPPRSAAHARAQLMVFLT